MEQSLREQLKLSEGELFQLEENLKSVDDELVVLRREQDKYDKLESICKSLEELDEMGAGHLFWDSKSRDELDARLEHSRWEVGKYHESMVEVENRKEKILADIEPIELIYNAYFLLTVSMR